MNKLRFIGMKGAIWWTKDARIMLSNWSVSVPSEFWVKGIKII
jgi:hypothetical protein